MSPSTPPPESWECLAIGERLAWYANGTLGPADRAAVDTHLEQCAGCRRALAAERRIIEAMRAPRDNVEQSPHAGWQKLVARLDAEDATAASVEPVTHSSPSIDDADASPTSVTAQPAGRKRVNWPAALGTAVAVQAAAIAVLTVALVRHRQMEEAPRYRTLSSADPTLAASGPLVRIAFDAAVDEAAARAIAARVNGRILAGPSPENVYTFVLSGDMDAGRSLDQQVSALRKEAHVLLVEPVILGEQRHKE
jgi:hypothetical protein